MKYTIELENIEYGKKYLEYIKNDGTVHYRDGDNFIYNNLKFSKEAYTSDEIVEVRDMFKGIIDNTLNGFINTFESRDMKATDEQLYFARETSNVVLGELKEKDIIPVIPAPCGFGKSTIKLEIIKELIKLYKDEDKNITNGVIIVGDRLDDLRELQDRLKECDLEGYTYMLESWNEDICINKRLKEAKPKMCFGCDYFYKCKIGEQQKEQSKYPILLITNARLRECGESIKRYKKYNNGERTLLLIDERPEMLDTVKVNKALLNEIDTHIASLNYNDLEDKTKLTSYWKEISEAVENKMISLRGKYKRFIVNNKCNIGICKDNDKFMELWCKYLKSDYKRELEHINTVLTKGGFYVCENNTEFIATIGLRDLINDYCNDFKTIIFDGSALYDPLYISLYESNKIKYLYIPNSRTYGNLDIKVNNEKITKTRFKDVKYLTYGLSEYIKNKCKIGFRYNYVVTYKEFSGKMGDYLEDPLRNNIVKMNDGSCFYFGNTKGSNAMSKCNRMIQVGWDTMPDYEYAIQFLCSSNLWDKLLDVCATKDKAERYSELFEKKDRSVEKIKDKSYSSDFRQYEFGLSSINEFVYFDIVSKFYQEVHRTKLRQYDCTDNIEVILFKNRKVIFDLIRGLFPKCKIEYNENELKELREAKDKTFTKSDGTMTDKQKILDWFDKWNGERFKVADFRNELGISSKRWEKLKKEESILNRLNECTIPKKGYYERIS